MFGQQDHRLIRQVFKALDFIADAAQDFRQPDDENVPA